MRGNAFPESASGPRKIYRRPRKCRNEKSQMYLPLYQLQFIRFVSVGVEVCVSVWAFAGTLETNQKYIRADPIFMHVTAYMSIIRCDYTFLDFWASFSVRVRSALDVGVARVILFDFSFESGEGRIPPSRINKNIFNEFNCDLLPVIYVGFRKVMIYFVYLSIFV